MGTVTYEIVPKGKEWTVKSGDRGPSAGYTTKEAALEAAVMAASNAIKEGFGITITVPEPAPGQDTLGADRQ